MVATGIVSSRYALDSRSQNTPDLLIVKMSANYQAWRNRFDVRHDHGPDHEYLDRNPKQKRLKDKQSGFFAKVDIAQGTQGIG
ncbi:hypothetical protein VTL71DRAFT_6156 [Oculimacula yallundae]|uniref:Uncharacterized protein n=1 Tax=Oculimacula yallundae TaxID=86028 RepID=A0ABR4BZJ1_9HELO